MKFPKPFFRKSKQAWYLQVGKKQVSLGRNRDAAFERYRQIMLHERGQLMVASSALTVEQVSDLFLEHSQRHNEPATYEWYRQYLQDFCDHYGSMVALDLKPFHVNQWLDKHTGWADGSRRCAITAIKRAFNWAEGEGILPANPVKRVRKPPAQSRDRILTLGERQEILTAIKDQAFRDFVFALQETGCRPSEVRRVTANNVDLVQGIWIFFKHKTFKKTRKPRIVYLTPAMLELSRQLVERYPTGPLFRGPRSKNGFTRNGVRCRFRNLRKKLPHLAGVISYTYRHSFVTDALENGVGVVEVAELIGDKGTDMVMRHYQHLNQRREHLRQAAIKATQRPEDECA